PVLNSRLCAATAPPPWFPGRSRPPDSFSNPRRTSHRRTGSPLSKSRRPTTLAWRSRFWPTSRNAISVCTSRNRECKSTQKEDATMKTSLSHRIVIVSVILSSRSFYRDSALAQGCPVPSFAAERTFEVGSEGSPWSLAVRDLNGDGNLDVVVANYGCSPCSPPIRGSVSVLVGNGDGTFQAVAKYDSGPNPQSVAVGDFNGDGKPDLAVANDGSTNIAVLLGNGDATFQAAVSYGMGGAPPRATDILTTGDFNGDNKLDLAV